MPRRSPTQAMVAVPETGSEHVLALYHAIQRSHVKLIASDGKAETLPSSLYEFLVKLSDELRKGQSVAIVEDEAHLTTVEAAKILGVSRQFLVNLLDGGEIAHHMVGTHRRIYVRDLLAYKTKRDANRRRILDELSRAEAEDGLYDLEAPNDPAA